MYVSQRTMMRRWYATAILSAIVSSPIFFGVATPAEPTAPAMSSLEWQLKDDQIAAVVTLYPQQLGYGSPAGFRGRCEQTEIETGKSQR